MPDEKRIKDFEPATELLIDDWFAVDSPSQGTRKMQASMFQEGLQTQITTNTENIALHSGQISVLQQGVGNIGDKVDVLDAAITVEAYSASKLYAVGEDCVYEGVRYKCITAIETPEAFDPNKWQAISIEGELNELNSSLTPKEFTVTAGENITIAMQKCYKIGKLAVLKITAKATQNITGSKIIINFPSGMRALQNGSVFISGQGSQWGISNFEYTYLTTNGIITDNLTANTFIHIDTTIVIE